ncbi:MAG: leucyl/phenylalanyl-tRNA--protein transferase [Methyloceanibacter sp.]|uniref:leucyl/phenylalanyl-tRNA--protein transferase n=1 Tax=Methyloceanibacter sp. TaxID=1965321 RepID=UPI003D6D8240
MLLHRMTAELLHAPATLAMMAKRYARFGGEDLPDPERALRRPDGLAGVCGALNVPALLEAYARGLYADQGKWWAPAERMVSFPDNVYVAKTVRRLLQTRAYDVTFDQDFARVVRACAPGTEIERSFLALHEAGHAHSVEVWDRAGRLDGGLYGVAVGRAFFTERMVSRARTAAKVGLITLSCHLQHWGFVVNDGKRMSGALSQLGFMPIPRPAFNRLLAKACRDPSRSGKWAIDETLDVSRWNPKMPGSARARSGTRASILPFTLPS